MEPFIIGDRVVHKDTAHGVITSMSTDRIYAIVQFDGVLRPYFRTVRVTSLTHEPVEEAVRE